MGPAATTAAGIVVGLVLFLAMAMMGVIAVNGTNNPGVSQSPHQPSAAAGSSAEKPVAEPKRGSFHPLDLNADGKLSLGEAAGYSDIVTRFDRADRNRDGKLTEAEFERLGKLGPPKAAKSKVAKKKAPRREETTAATGG